MDCDHLGTALGDDYVREDLSAVAGGGLAEVAVLVKAEVYGVCCKSRLEAYHKSGRQISAQCRCAVDENGRLMLFNELRKCRLIRSGAVLSQCLALCKDDLVCAVLKQSIRKRGNVIASRTALIFSPLNF